MKHENLANCLVNTDFYLSRGVVIKKTAETIVFENPGSIRTGKARMLRGGISDPRNASILKMLNLIGIGERAGSGVPDIFATWEQQGWIEPEVEEQYGPDRTILTLSFFKKVMAKSGNGVKNIFSEQDSEQGSEQESAYDSDHDDSYEEKIKRLREYCIEPRTRQEMQDFLGVSSRGYFLRKFIAPMVNDGKLRLTIPEKPTSRNQKYVKT